MAMNSSAGLGNLLRLQGLKSVSSRRKVLPEEEDFQEEESTLPEVGGTATPNVPQEDMQRGGIDPQSYDVRANQVIPMGEEEPENFWSNFGKNLSLESQGITPQKDQGIAPPISTQQVEKSEGLPPVNPEMQEGMPQEASANYPRLRSLSNVIPKEKLQGLKPEDLAVLEKALGNNANKLEENKAALMPREVPKPEMETPVVLLQLLLKKLCQKKRIKNQVRM